MYYSKYFQSLTRTIATLSFFSLSMVLATNPVNAFDLNFESDFESGLSNWQTTGDVSTQPTLTGTYGGASKSYHAGGGTGDQLVLTTACPSDPYVDGECYDTQNTGSVRNDDPNATAGTFNLTEVTNNPSSGNDQTDANAENAGFNTGTPGSEDPDNNVITVQEFLDLGPNALDIPAEDGSSIIGGNRTAKEGSAALLKETIVASNPFTVSFDWNYLTNDGQNFDPNTSTLLGDSDYGFAVIYDVASNTEDREPIVLADSDSSTIPNINLADTAYALSTADSYTSEILPAGTYQVGFGVVDADGVNRSSALLVDNYSAQEVPFEFSPATGIALVATFLCLNRLRNKSKPKNVA